MTMLTLLRNVFTVGLLLAWCALPVQAQNRTVRGTVTDAQTGEMLPGVNVIVQGTMTGTTTNAEGEYAISVSPQADSLQFSFVGFATETVPIAGRSVIDVALQPAVERMADVVVTALGIERERREIGYSIQDVAARDVVNAQESNIVNALRGKVAGAKITSTGGAPGQSARIVIRGLNSLDPGANNQPLFVVDGVPISNEVFKGGGRGSGGYAIANGAADINPQNIQSISILRGAAATALYGVRAANGAVIIETKRGHAGQTRVQFSSSFGIERVNKFPDQQTEFLAGWYGKPNYKSYDFPFHAWGPKADTVSGAQFYENNRNFFGTDGPGKVFSSNLSVSGGNQNATFYLSLGYQDHQGVVPNSSDRSFSTKATGTVELFDGFKVTATANYVKDSGVKIPVDGQLGQLIYWPTSVDIRNWRNENGTQNTYTPWLDHPIFIDYNWNMANDRNRFIGTVGFQYDVADWLTLNYKLGNDLYDDAREEVLPGPRGIEGENPLSSLGLIQRDDITNRELTSLFRARVSRQFTDTFGARLIVGNDLNFQNYDRVTVEGTDFGTPGFYHLSNVSDITTSEYQQQKRIIGVFGDLQLNYNDYLYLDLTARNDWSSTLPEGNRSFFYPSASLGFIFSDVVDLPDFMNYGKFRASVAWVGKDTEPYRTGVSYNSFTFKGRTALTKDDELGSELKPERTRSIEFGADLRFFDDRLGLDVTVYQENTTDMIYPVPVSEATGFSSYFTNLGEMRNRGIEVTAFGTPVETQAFSWNVSANFAKNENVVLEIGQGIDAVTLYGTSFSYGGSLYMQLREGMPYGNIFGPVYQRYYEDPANEDPLRIDEGRPILIGDDGFPVVKNDGYKIVGNAQPDWTAGLTNTFSYKNLELSFLVDIKQGGDLYNQVAAFYAAQGTLPVTAQRDAFRVFEGVRADGSPNAQRVWLGQGVGPDGVDYGDGYFRNVYRRVSEHFVEDASWVRLRTLSLTYSLPNSLVQRSPLSRASITFTGKNLWLSTPYSGFDPEARQFDASSNTQGFQGLRTPAVRSFVLSMNLTF